MGDHANDAIEAGLQMMLEDEDEYCEYDFEPQQNVTCKYCKERGFTWTSTKGGWRLMDSKGFIHNCWDSDEKTALKSNRLSEPDPEPEPEPKKRMLL